MSLVLIRSRRWLLLSLALVFFSAIFSPQVAAQTPPPSVAELTRIAPDVYVWRNSGYNSLIILTDDGVIVTDPSSQINVNAADLLKAVVRSLTDKPVKYVVYSHDHSDHIRGGSAFADTAQFVSQTRAKEKIAAENNARTPIPQITFDDRMSLELGGKKVDLYFTGRNHSDNSIVVHYPARGVVYAADFIPVKTVLFRTLPDAYPEEWVDSLSWVERNLSFTYLVPGHGAIGSKQNVVETREYLTSLMFWVRTARGEGLDDNSPEMVERVKAALKPTYGEWMNFESELPENIQGLIRIWGSR